MKENKITRKIKRLQILNDVFSLVQDRIDEYVRKADKNEELLKKYLQDEEEDREEWSIAYYQEELETSQVKLDEAKKLLADLEKMA